MPHGIAAHAKSIIEFNLPAGSTRFRAFAALDDGALKQPLGATVRFLVFAVPPNADADRPGLPVPIRWEELGLKGPCKVRDLWQKKDLGEFAGEFAPVIAWHGAGLYRISGP